MENGPPTIGLEDVTNIDVEDVSRSFGGSDNSNAQEREDTRNGEVLDAMPCEVEDGYFQVHNDFCRMGGEYLQGVEFAECITNLDYGSSEALQAPVQDSLMQSASIELSDIIPNFHESEVMEQKSSVTLSSCTSINIGKFENNSSSSFQDIVSDENNRRLSPLRKIFCSSKTAKNNESELISQRGETKTMSVQATQKRARKPTQRYIDELADPISTYSKKRRGVSSAIPKDKSRGVDNKKCRMRSKEITFSDQDFSVKAIQVPFASLGHKECSEGHAYDMHADNKNLMAKLKGKRVTPENRKTRDECITSINLKKRDECITSINLKKKNDSPKSQKKRDDSVTATRLNKKLPAANQKKKNKCTIAVSKNERVECGTIDDSEISEETSVRRKHHTLWTITEVRKLIDGVSQYGVGRWSQIKKLSLAAAAHRTCVDLKDKWRNLLKASGVLEQGNTQGEKKRSVAWRPLPKSILRRVRELDAMYPYRKGQRFKIANTNNNNNNHESPDINTDITLSDYRKILRSINEN